MVLHNELLYYIRVININDLTYCLHDSKPRTNAWASNNDKDLDGIR